MSARIARGLARVCRVIAAAVVLVPAGCAPPASPPPSVVLVVLDTVRADHLSCYGYPRPTTPNLDRLAREGELFRAAFAQSSWTLPSVATIMTGHPPRVHGATLGPEALYPVRTEVPIVAQRLAAVGFHTAAFMNVAFCSPESGLARGFENYDYKGAGPGEQARTAGATVDAALAWLSALETDDPFLLVLHLFDPHLPYDPPPPYDTLFEPDEQGRVGPEFGVGDRLFAIRRGEVAIDARTRRSVTARYDGELRYTDEQLGRLREGLESLGRWSASLVVVVADHGEELWDHGGFEHGHTHFAELIHVPLIVRRPVGPRGVVHQERVRQIDVVPTVLDVLGLPPDPTLPGVALGSHGAPYSVAEGSLWSGELVSVRSDRGTLIVNRDTGEQRYFAPDDPTERGDGSASRPADAASLAALLAALPAPRGVSGEGWRPTDDEREALRALGYLP